MGSKIINGGNSEKSTNVKKLKLLHLKISAIQ